MTGRDGKCALHCGTRRCMSCLTGRDGQYMFFAMARYGRFMFAAARDGKHVVFHDEIRWQINLFQLQPVAVLVAGLALWCWWALLVAVVVVWSS